MWPLSRLAAKWYTRYTRYAEPPMIPTFRWNCPFNPAERRMLLFPQQLLNDSSIMQKLENSENSKINDSDQIDRRYTRDWPKIYGIIIMWHRPCSPFIFIKVVIADQKRWCNEIWMECVMLAKYLDWVGWFPTVKMTSQNDLILGCGRSFEYKSIINLSKFQFDSSMA